MGLVLTGTGGLNNALWWLQEPAAGDAGRLRSIRRCCNGMNPETWCWCSRPNPQTQQPSISSVLVSPCTSMVPLLPHFGQSAIPFQVPMDMLPAVVVDPAVPLLTYPLQNQYQKLSSPSAAFCGKLPRPPVMNEHVANISHRFGEPGNTSYISEHTL